MLKYLNLSAAEVVVTAVYIDNNQDADNETAQLINGDDR